MQIQIPDTQAVSLKKAETSVVVDFANMPKASLEHVFNYGIRQILNDAMASAKSASEGKAMAQKRLDNLMSGTLRASPVREGNPVRKRALEIAEAKIVKNAKFIAWAQAAGIKVSHKDAVKKLREHAVDAIEKDGNPYMPQAEIDVAAAKAIDADDLELDFE